MIPLASLAAILLVVGYKLAKPSLFKEMYKKGWSHLIPFVVTILGIVFIDLLKGISLGLAVGILQILYNNFKTPYHFKPSDYVPGQPIKISLSEDVSFLNKAGILKTLTLLPNDSHVIFDATETKTIHQDVIEILEDFRPNAETRGINLELVGFDELKSNENPLKNFKLNVLQGTDSSQSS